MKSARLFVKTLEMGMSPVEALHSIPNYEQRYIGGIPIEVYRAALRYGWRFFPVFFSKHLTLTHLNLSHATDDLPQLRIWSRLRPNWAVLLGPSSGVFAVRVYGEKGLASFLALCGDDWNWLDTLRTLAGKKRCIFFAWPEGRRPISNDRHMGDGLKILGEGDWVFTPPSRELYGLEHFYLNPGAEIRVAPAWLLDRAFEPDDDTVDPSQSVAIPDSVPDVWPNALAAGTNFRNMTVTGGDQV